jgi:hypothetical protein
MPAPSLELVDEYQLEMDEISLRWSAKRDAPAP